MMVFLVFAIVLSACSGANSGGGSGKGTGGSGSGSNSGSGNTTAGTDGGSSEKQLAPYEVVIAFWTPEQKDMGLVEEEISKITKERFNATVKLKRIEPAAYTQQKVLMFSSNEHVDIIFTGERQYTSEVAQKQLLPLDDLLQSHGQGILEAFQPEVLDAARVSGKIYGIPTIRDLAAYPTVLMRKDIVEQNNIDLSSVKSLEDLGAVFATVKANHPNLNILGKASGGATLAYSLLLTQIDPLADNIGVLIDTNSLKVVNLYETEEYKNFLMTLHEWFKAGYMPKDISTTTQSWTDYVKAGIGFAGAGKGKPGIVTQASGRAGVELVEVPLAKQKMNTLTITNAMLAIARNSRDPERAMMFLNLLYSDPEVINLLHWGIEGKHYKKLDNGTIDYADGVDASNSGYNHRQGWMFGNQLLAYPWVTDSPDIWKQMGEFNDNAEKSAALGFMWDPEPVKTELAAIENVIQQYAAGLETGTLDPETNLPKFIDALKAAGIDEIIAEKQRQLDEWAANR
jgi:putative aldouronate transport system substrate-binding protein